MPGNGGDPVESALPDREPVQNVVRVITDLAIPIYRNSSIRLDIFDN